MRRTEKGDVPAPSLPPPAKTADAPARAEAARRPHHLQAHPSQATSAGGLVVLYDADCAFCTASVRRLRRWDRDGKFDLVPLQSAATSPDPALRAAAARYPLQTALHVVDRRTGRVSAGGRAMLTILDALPGGRLLRPWAALPTVPVMADLVYGVVSDRRQDLGWAVGIRHEVACPVHGGETKGD
jgi:predicted DCC family thiol-disulfide oxidoreductase YuxK